MNGKIFTLRIICFVSYFFPSIAEICCVWIIIPFEIHMQILCSNKWFDFSSAAVGWRPCWLIYIIKHGNTFMIMIIVCVRASFIIPNKLFLIYLFAVPQIRREKICIVYMKTKILYGFLNMHARNARQPTQWGSNVIEKKMPSNNLINN